MDPFSITASLLPVTAQCLSTVKALHDLQGKYKNAQLTISALCSETSIISASLFQIQSLVSRDADGFTNRLQSKPELEITFNTALTGCMVIFSVLESEAQSLLLDASALTRLAGMRRRNASGKKTWWNTFIASSLPWVYLSSPFRCQSIGSLLEVFLYSDMFSGSVSPISTCFSTRITLCLNKSRSEHHRYVSPIPD